MSEDLLVQEDSLVRTLDWHSRVQMSYLAKFGEMPAAHKRLNLAQTLVEEEADELVDELRLMTLKAARGQEITNDDRARAAKEAADLIFVALQAVQTLGLVGVFPLIYEEVLRSNESKLLDGKATFNEAGKLLKGPQYSPADVLAIVDSYIS